MSEAINIYPVHEYGDETHFKALYDCGSDYGYSVKGQIILRKRAIIKRLAKTVLQRRKPIEGIKQFIIDTVNHFKLRFLKNEILIAGIAPYDTLLNKYQNIFKGNKAYYFTSHLYWDGSEFPRGSIDNKDAYERLLTKCFKGAYCVSAATEAQVRKYIKNTSIVYHAIDFKLYKKVSSALENKTVKRYIFAGGFTDRKNIRLIMEWLKNNSDENVSIELAGDGPLKTEVNDFIKTDNRLVNLGFCSKKQLQEILCTYDFMLLPSKEEPFGIALLEALAAGTPCIVSNAVGPEEIIDDGIDGFVFDLSNAYDNFDLAMKKSLSLGQEQLEAMRNNAVKKGFSYDSSEIIKRWLKLLKP